MSSAEVVAGIAARHPITHQHQFIYELGRREYFRHVWARRGDQILQSLHAGPMPDTAYEGEVPADIREGRSGVPVIDQAMRTLYATGYLHNHARMWLASYLVHIRHVHWRAGADWMIAHLLDGDLASNHLSWQWVAGTGSGKPYVFNADNVAKYAPPSWHSFGSVLDTSYAALLRLAHGAPAPAPMPHDEGIPEPALLAAPIAGMASAPATTPATMAGRDVWLVHP
ncbi:FAD-binding domain-containing protein [Oxalobacteraceae bacterium A2-2]